MISIVVKKIIEKKQVNLQFPKSERTFQSHSIHRNYNVTIKLAIANMAFF